MNTFTYKSYTGVVEVDPKAGILFGRVIDLDAVLTFEAENVREAEQAFRDTVDDYLDWCKERGKIPEKPFSGTLYIRTTPAVHRAAVIAAARQHKISMSGLPTPLIQRPETRTHNQSCIVEL